MPTIFAANESSVLINGEPIEGVQSVEYRNHQERDNVYALGSAERIGMISGPQYVDGRISVNSTSPGLDRIVGESMFQITSQLRHGETQMTVSFDDCYLTEKTFKLDVGGVGSAVYMFTATRVREELG